VKATADAFAENPVLSPDGRQFAFALSTLKKDGTVQLDVRMANIDGTNVRPAAVGEYAKISFSFPAWSADGKDLYVTQSYPVPPAGQYDEIDRLPASGGTPKKVIEGRAPSISGDGKRIAFLRFDFKTFTSSLWVTDIDGKNEKRLVDQDAFLTIFAPRFSPDGKLVLFAASGPPNKKLPGISFARPPSNRCAIGFPPICIVENAYADGLPWDLWTVTVDGSKFEQITNIGTDSPYPAWSPDGKYIGFFDLTGIYVIDREKKVIYPAATRGGHGGFDWR
jgi:Tol biopolymer transport system component